MGDAAQPDARFRSRVWRILLASIVMGFFLAGGELLLSHGLGQDGVRYIALAALVAIGMGSYAVAGQLFGAFKLREFRAAVRNR